MTNIQKKFHSIKSQTFNLQKTFKACEMTITQILDETSSKDIIKKLIEYLIINLEVISKEKTETIKYTTNFNWVLTTEEIIIYSLLTFYDLKEFTVKNFLLQFEKELEIYSSYDAKNRIDFLLEGGKYDKRN